MGLPSENEIVLATAADEAYAVPLSITIRSALDCLDPNRRIKLFVLDGGLSEKTKARLLWSWIDPRLSVEWIRPDIEQVRDLPVSDHISVVAYVRLLMPALLPSSVSRIIYLDSDMLIRRDLAELWDETPRTHPLFAVQEYAAPYFDSSAVLDRYELCQKHLAANHPIANFRELGLPGQGKYFNSGLLVINLAEWRRKRYAEEVLACLRKHRQHVLWWDQYALNVVFAGKWGELDRRWNQGAHLYVYPNWRESPFDQQTFDTLRADPWIVHFCSPSKPWHYFCHHPLASEWRRSLRQTDWRNWKPEKPEQYLTKLWGYYYQPLRSEWKRRVRGVKQTIRQKYRRAA
jgi:lipopolysaccharide biosynthesis glycosyltransferase